jgi:hypothetical protein
MKSHDTTIMSKKSGKSSQSTSRHSKATDGTYKTAAWFEQIPEDEQLPIDATNKLQMDLHHLQLNSSNDQYIVPSTTYTLNQIQSLHFPSPSVPPLKLRPPSSELQQTSSTFSRPSSSSTPLIPHQGSAAATETSVSGTSKRSSKHSRKYKSGELLIGNDDAKSAQLHSAFISVGRSSESRKSSISEKSGQKSRKTARTSYSNPGSGVPPSSISVRHSTLCPSVLARSSEDESVSHPYSQHKSDATKHKEMASIKSYGTSTLIHKVDELIDGASSDMRGVAAQFDAFRNSDDKKKKIVQELSGDKTRDGKTHSSAVPVVAGRTTRSSSRAKQLNRP